jgi:hypothetical protein
MMKRCAECGCPTAAPVEQGGVHYCQEHAATAPDMVNSPHHYTRGPIIDVTVFDPISGDTAGDTHIIECIEVIRHIRDMRLANAMKYVWRVAFGGKANDREDIQKAIWYLRDWLDNPVSETP